MKVIRQGEDECMLTTISALSRVPLKQVREMALTLAKCDSWEEVVGNHPLYWKVISKLQKDVGLLKRKIPTEASELSKGNKRKKLPKGKEGSICTKKVFGFGAHIDPFSNGMVWGTLGEIPITLEEYTNQISINGGRITGIWY